MRQLCFFFVIAALCISNGVVAQIASPLRQLDRNIDKEVSKHFRRRTLDDYLQYVPSTAVFGLDLSGVKARNNFRDRTFVVVTSHLIMTGMVHAVKMTTSVERPDGSSHRSFPSGHTATSFVGAHILFKEYREVSPWIGMAGYVTAATVGTMRILNRKHWLSDVVAGAGVGILSVEISYLLLPVFHRIIGVERNRPALVISPVVRNNLYGLGMVYVF